MTETQEKAPEAPPETKKPTKPKVKKSKTKVTFKKSSFKAKVTNVRKVDGRKTRVWGLMIRPEGCITPNEAGERIGCTGENVKQRIYKGDLKAAKAKNGYYWIRETDLAEFVKGLNDASKLNFETRSNPKAKKATKKKD